MNTRCRGAKLFGAAANAVSIPPGEYGRKTETQRNWRGLAQAVEHVVQFDATRKTLPGLDIPLTSLEIGISFGTEETGGAWLSSARVVRCWVKSRNERNPYRQLLTFSWELWRDCRWQIGGRWGRRQIIMPLMAWATHVLQWPVQRAAKRWRGANLKKPVSVRIVVCNSTTWSWNR